MTHCEKCISYDICKFHQAIIADEFITFFPNNEGCPYFKNKADYVEVAEITNKIDFAIEATNENSDYDVGLRNGLRLAMSFIDGKQPQYERSNT